MTNWDKFTVKEHIFVNVAFIVIDAEITAKLKLLGRFVFDNTNASGQSISF